MSNSSSSSISTSHSRGSKRYTHSSYDDKDGHYRVVPNTEFTNRCNMFIYILLPFIKFINKKKKYIFLFE